MYRYIEKTMYLEKSKRPIILNVGSTSLYRPHLWLKEMSKYIFIPHFIPPFLRWSCYFSPLYHNRTENSCLDCWERQASNQSLVGLRFFTFICRPDPRSASDALPYWTMLLLHDLWLSTVTYHRRSQNILFLSWNLSYLI